MTSAKPPSMRLIEVAFGLGPLFFGIGFLAPVIAASFEALGQDVPFGLSPIHFGLGLGALLGLVAVRRRTWLW